MSYLDDVLPAHPTIRDPRNGEPLRAIGVTSRGPVWPVMGGDGTSDDDTSDDDAGSDSTGDDQPDADDDGTGGDTDPDGADQLGDPGKKALNTMKEQRNAARAEARGFRQLANEFGVKTAEELKKLISGKGKPADTPDQPDADQIRREALATATKSANERILRAEVKAAAAGKLADPADAFRFLDLSTVDVDDDGTVDADQIAEAIADLIEKKPYLAAQSTRKWQGGADSGARKGQPKPPQLTEADVKRMTPEQIVEAQEKGQLNDLLGAT
jgi:hypothetical protein